MTTLPDSPGETAQSDTARRTGAERNVRRMTRLVLASSVGVAAVVGVAVASEIPGAAARATATSSRTTSRSSSSSLASTSGTSRSTTASRTGSGSVRVGATSSTPTTVSGGSSR